ncbi:hypothetical protein D9758_008753 [Tetrapyrgos nigripes]|uniref:Uncharacterized protein n=1 Tax=Tetrapyrgos nigripes TaxID=182062 RepID=A0A8H5D3P2_9AGAR|nr:hypothetical protein D9758_008753 [Tetrapyrgos nigripes]
MTSIPTSSVTLTSTPSTSDHGTQKLTQVTQGSQSRPHGSSVLWSHLLRKDSALPAPSSSFPHASGNSDLPPHPMTPQDKHGTSTRILLHDTQANLQKFGEQVESLTSTVDDARQEIMVVKRLFRDEHESTMGDILDLVNRSQTELQKSMGKPAQAEKMEQLYNTVDTRLENLSKRIDALQMLYPTHSQALQAQAQVLQTIQEQQGTILTALLPLLPLLQAIPLHIESARNTINDSLSVSLKSIQITATPPQKSTGLAIPPTLSVSRASNKRSRKETNSGSPTSKRRRVEENEVSGGRHARQSSRVSTHHTHSSPLGRVSVTSSRHRNSAKSKSVLLASLKQKSSFLSRQDPKTPRRPLAGLSLMAQGHRPLHEDLARRSSDISRRPDVIERSPTVSVIDGPQPNQTGLIIMSEKFSSPVGAPARRPQHSPALSSHLLPASSTVAAPDNSDDLHMHADQRNLPSSASVHRLTSHKPGLHPPLLSNAVAPSSNTMSLFHDVPVPFPAPSHAQTIAAQSPHVQHQRHISHASSASTSALNQQTSTTTTTHRHNFNAYNHHAQLQPPTHNHNFNSTQSHLDAHAPLNAAARMQGGVWPHAPHAQPGILSMTSASSGTGTLVNHPISHVQGTPAPVMQNRAMGILPAGTGTGSGNMAMGIPIPGTGPSRRRRSPFREGRRFIPLLDDSDDSDA